MAPFSPASEAEDASYLFDEDAQPKDVPGLSEGSSADAECESEDIEGQAKDISEQATKRLKLQGMQTSTGNNVSNNSTRTGQASISHLALAPAPVATSSKALTRSHDTSHSSYSLPETDDGRIVWFPRKWPNHLDRVLLYKVKVGQRNVLKYLRVVFANIDRGRSRGLRELRIPISKLFDSALYDEAVSCSTNP